MKVNSTLKLHGCSVSNPKRDGVDKAADGPSFFLGQVDRNVSRKHANPSWAESRLDKFLSLRSHKGALGGRPASSHVA